MHSFGMHIWKRPLGFPLPPRRQEVAHPQEVSITHSNVRSGGAYPPEPSIRNVEVWLDWWAHQMDTTYWWAELTAIPDVAGPKEVSLKDLCLFFDPWQLRCEAFPDQEYTATPCPQMSHQK